MKAPVPQGTPRKPLPPGVVTGLALTRSGAVAATVECMLLSGHGKLILTGNLVGAARDSAQVALSLARSHTKRFGIDPADFHHTDAHFHVVEMLPSKGGPSVGLAMFAALVSAMLRKPVDPRLGFTGEISLSGRVHPVDGIAAKVSAATRAGVTRLFVPAGNAADVLKPGKKAPRGLEIIPVADVDEALEVVFGKRVRAGVG
jgi:ATP-dependent Lon protease